MLRTGVIHKQERTKPTNLELLSEWCERDRQKVHLNSLTFFDTPPSYICLPNPCIPVARTKLNRQNKTLSNVFNGMPKVVRNLCLEYISSVSDCPITTVFMFFMQGEYKIKISSTLDIKNANIYKFHRILKHFAKRHLKISVNSKKYRGNNSDLYFFDRGYYYLQTKYNLFFNNTSNEVKHVLECVDSLTIDELYKIKELYLKLNN
jgi:hypothetical protein